MPVNIRDYLPKDRPFFNNEDRILSGRKPTDKYKETLHHPITHKLGSGVTVPMFEHSHGATHTLDGIMLFTQKLLHMALRDEKVLNPVFIEDFVDHTLDKWSDPSYVYVNGLIRNKSELYNTLKRNG